ncbi:MAG: hypothetical protein M1825_001662 [Sarcosagium campestre]|nr:MAG: hypothetical protein M1825_001662 [Sarcosagium campestre]
MMPSVCAIGFLLAASIPAVFSQEPRDPIWDESQRVVGYVPGPGEPAFPLGPEDATHQYRSFKAPLGGDYLFTIRCGAPANTSGALDMPVKPGGDEDDATLFENVKFIEREGNLTADASKEIDSWEKALHQDSDFLIGFLKSFISKTYILQVEPKNYSLSVNSTSWQYPVTVPGLEIENKSVEVVFKASYNVNDTACRNNASAYSLEFGSSPATPFQKLIKQQKIISRFLTPFMYCEYSSGYEGGNGSFVTGGETFWPDTPCVTYATLLRPKEDSTPAAPAEETPTPLLKIAAFNASEVASARYRGEPAFPSPVPVPTPVPQPQQPAPVRDRRRARA